MRRRALMIGTLVCAVTTACAPLAADNTWVLLDQEARDAGVTVYVDDTPLAPILPVAIEAGALLTIETDEAAVDFATSADEVVWIRGADGWVDPVTPVDRNRIAVTGAADAVAELADWLGAEHHDSVLYGDDIWSALAAEPEAPVGLDSVLPLVDELGAQAANAAYTTPNAPTSTTGGAQGTLRACGLINGPPAPALQGVSESIRSDLDLADDDLLPLVGLYRHGDGCVLVDLGGEWSRCRDDFVSGGSVARADSRVFLSSADDTRPWHWDGRDLRDPSGRHWTLETP